MTNDCLVIILNVEVEIDLFFLIDTKKKNQRTFFHFLLQLKSENKEEKEIDRYFDLNTSSRQRCSIFVYDESIVRFQTLLFVTVRILFDHVLSNKKVKLKSNTCKQKNGIFDKNSNSLFMYKSSTKRYVPTFHTF